MQIKQTRDTMSDIYFEALKIRNEVFVKEQGVPYRLEVENPADEAQSVHFIGCVDGHAIATVRLLKQADGSAVIQRMAVLKAYRSQHYGSEILQALIDFAKQENISPLVLHAQLTAKPFYDGFGFEAEGEVFEEAGIMHVTMVKK
ncbi:GNAT family N-acetyltransferase [Lactococcus termiticola]|uniref:GNAT family acetyltransferase n=1 Tax=Lactococcus termiticola TaxID=2169526 RepID=A0A2R5HKA6_9LACT|nr:GNAT family N-acetyltransferase [Lactococcus termiticola]GBG96941.1 GNAT family acetyltransferase [Lactococcus termiticola]